MAKVHAVETIPLTCSALGGDDSEEARMRRGGCDVRPRYRLVDRRVGLVVDDGVNSGAVETFWTECARHGADGELIADHDGEVVSHDETGAEVWWPVDVLLRQTCERDYDGMAVLGRPEGGRRAYRHPRTVSLVESMIRAGKAVGFGPGSEELAAVVRDGGSPQPTHVPCPRGSGVARGFGTAKSDFRSVLESVFALVAQQPPRAEENTEPGLTAGARPPSHV